MTPIMTNTKGTILFLLISQIEWIDGFAGNGLGRPSRRPVSALSHRIDRRNGCSDLSIDAYDQRARATANNDRRSFLSNLASSSLAAGSSFLYPAENANALPFFGASDRRQLELCLVTILRTQYWATNTAASLKSKLLSPTANSKEDFTDTIPTEAEIKMLENAKKQPYLEARLGAKALLTQKIGGGANGRVKDLGGFQLKECLEDANYWCGELANKNQLPSQRSGGLTTKQAKRMCSTDLITATEEIVESLGSLVEFDGLETTIDPSPRSSLMLSMYNPQKGTFVYRTLVERVVPSCERYSKLFGEDRMRLVEEFVRRDYAEEVPFEVLAKMYGDE
mmetsp:Transcript_27306/g.58682  ORF Transcript_27306/g.58682 Transcript_27306/m.58682 type:complete len:337 (-) Transcript_27306:177-1187(-)